jgi:preprotein translocase subunit YajC
MVNAGSLVFLVAIFALMWLLLIRPQKAKQQKQRELLSSIEPGDEILTVGGLFGIVQSIDEDDELIVEIADGIHVRIARRAVGTVVKPDIEDADDAEGADEEDAEAVEAEGDSSVEAEEKEATAPSGATSL